ncbi:hypothetical protein [Streptomyces sp. BE303]|uniref:hypothetical protein n=1 Tax=Streptomyces sp. BE303 TaxID=3002528 RepID=UPI002E765CCD|nr:hypothetical protein [Streptomyces sp. BE303]MED7950250.1 hypothetical protein [Streptomyces sp. BE303]
MRLRHAFGLTVVAATAVLGLSVPAVAGPAAAVTTFHTEQRVQAQARTALAGVPAQLRTGVDPRTAVLQPGERVQVLGTNETSLLNSGAHYGYGVWATFSTLAATNRPFAESAVTSTAIGTTTDSVVHNVAAAGNRVFIADRRMSDGRWSSWGEITSPAVAGPLPGAPQQVATAVMGRKLHVLALVDGDVYQATGDWGAGSWSGWGNVSSAADLPLSTRVTAAVTGNSLHVVSLGLDDGVYVADGNYDRGTWSSGEPTSVIGLPSAIAISELSAAAIGSKLHVIAVTDERLYQATGDYAAGYWAGWHDLTTAAGPLGPIDDVSAVAIGNKLHLYALSRRWMYNATGDYDRSAWSGWGNVTTAVGAPGLTGLSVAAA